MTIDDWAVPAKLIERDDSGSELAYDFHERAHGTLAEMVARVAAMAGPDRARMLIDGGGLGMLNVGQILAMAGRDDFPG